MTALKSRDMGTQSALLAFCVAKPHITSGFLNKKGPKMRSFDIFIGVSQKQEVK